jgi:hypothetical protein
MVSLLLRKYRIAFILPLVITCIIVAMVETGQGNVKLAPFGDLNLNEIAFKLNFDFNGRIVYMLPLFLFHHLFDVIGTSLMLIRLAYFSNSIFVFNSNEIEVALSESSKVRVACIALNARGAGYYGGGFHICDYFCVIGN